MRVKIRTWLPAAFGLFVLTAFAGPAAAQCGSGCQPPPPPPPPCCQPPAPPPQPPCCRPPAPPVQPPCCVAPPPPVTPCCGGGNVNVNVNVNASARAGARAGSTVIVGGGGGAYFNVDQPYPTSIAGLTVESGAVAQVIRVPYEETSRFEKRVVIQAVCIDDRAIPHPASQVRPDREVDASYEGELYRCIAGTHLQVTIADYLDQVNFDHGETMVCAKNDALWHSGGEISCRAQRQERDCNERSLLRRYGAGIKILTIFREETVTAYREETVQAAGATITGASMTLDGGVGGRVF